MEKLWTTSEVAKFLGVHERDVEALLQQGTLTGYRVGGEFLRFRPEQVKVIKEQVTAHPTGATVSAPQAQGWRARALDFFYVYDFYLISLALLVIVVVYLATAH